MKKMKTSHSPFRRWPALCLLPLLALAVLGVFLARHLPAQDAAKDKPSADAPKDTTKPAPAGGDLVPLNIKLPAPAFKGTPKDIQLSSYVEPLPDKPRPPFMVPPGLKNLAQGLKPTCSDKNVPADELQKITDGDKEPSDASIVTLRRGTQWVQLDL